MSCRSISQRKKLSKVEATQLLSCFHAPAGCRNECHLLSDDYSFHDLQLHQTDTSRVDWTGLASGNFG